MALSHCPQTLRGVTLITGGASGMGRACAHAFAAAGSTKIVLLDINPKGLDEILNLTCDTSDEAQVQHAFATVRETFSRVDYAVNCAGIGQKPEATSQCTTENFDKTLAPLDAEIYDGIPSTRAQRGSIVHIASGLGVVASPLSPAYCSSKAGVIALARSDALDHSADRIRVNAVLPGAVATPLSHSNKEMKEGIEKYAVEIRTPLHRWGLAEEIADTCVFLCSNKASLIQGCSVPVDGGYIAN